MLKDVLKDWTRGLSEDDRARALAMLVALNFDSRAPEGGQLDVELIQLARTEKPQSWLNFEYAYQAQLAGSAGECARAWLATSNLRPQPIRLRVELRPWQIGSTDLIDWLDWVLRRPSTGVEGLYFDIAGLSSPRMPWRWPLSVCIPDGPDGDLLEAEIWSKVRPQWPDLVRIGRPAAGTEKGDILLIPSLPADDRMLERLARRHRASLVIALGSEPSHGWPAIATAFGSSAISMVDANLASAFVSLLVQLAHNEPIDLALARARDWNARSRLLLAKTEFIGASRLDTFLATLVRRAVAADAQWTVAATFRQPGLESLRPSRLPRLTDLSFARESYGATEIALVAADVEQKVVEVNAVRPTRWLQARVHADRPGAIETIQAGRAEELETARRFERNRWSLVGVHVGAPREALRVMQPLPEAELHFELHRETLGVVLAAPHCRVITLVRAGPQRPSLPLADGTDRDTAMTSIDLPELGDSNVAWFGLRPESDVVEARVMIMHGNRVLQTALLTGTTFESGVECEDGQIDLTLETIVHRGLESLHARRSFDAAFVVNDSSDGASRLTTVAGQRAELRSLDDAKEIFDGITGLVSRLIDQADDFSEPGSEALRSLLVDLANLGVALRRRIVADTDLIDLEVADRFQIVSARPEAVLPLEFVYDGEAPASDAPLCGEHANALQTGSCGKCPHRHGGEVVCPTRFWGLSRVIERHAFKRPAKGEPDFAVTAEPTPADRRFLPPASAAFAHSQRAAFTPVAKTALIQVSDNLEALTGQPCAPITSWDDWRHEVEAKSPSILALVPHSERIGAVDALEIATNQFLHAPQINGTIVGAKMPRLAVLFGCTTAGPTIPFASFPANLRHAGVEITVGTLSPVLGRHAAPALRDLVDALAEAWKSKTATSLAGLLARFRRDLMARGLPFGMAVVAFGDADWTFGG